MHFDKLYPLFVRRTDFFNSLQIGGQSFTAWLATLTQLSEEADLPTMIEDNIMVYQVVKSCNDSKLRERFLKLKNPTLQDLLRSG